MSNKQQYSTIQPEELPIINPEIQENKAKVRDILIKVLTMEGNKKLQTSDIKKEVAEQTIFIFKILLRQFQLQIYQQYLSNYRNYIEFKEYNHYAEKDEMFERLNTPVINNRGESIQRINSKANLIMNKYSKKELVRKRKQVRQDNNVRFNNHTTIDVMQRDQSLDGQGGGSLIKDSSIQQLQTLQDLTQNKNKQRQMQNNTDNQDTIESNKLKKKSKQFSDSIPEIQINHNKIENANNLLQNQKNSQFKHSKHQSLTLNDTSSYQYDLPSIVQQNKIYFLRKQQQLNYIIKLVNQCL